MSQLQRAGQSGALDVAANQAAAKEQIATLVDMLRQLGGNPSVVAGAGAAADPLNAPFTLYVDPYIGSDRFVGGAYNNHEAGATDEEVIAQKLKRIELQRLECGYTSARPFKTINRAAIEAAIITSKNWYTYSDPRAHVDCVTIVLSGGVHIVLNDPGSGTTNLSSWGTSKDPTLAELIAFNPSTGGVLLPRGCSMRGQDLRKTTIRPNWVTQVVDELADYSNRRAILKVSGTGFFFDFTVMDKIGHAESVHLLDPFQPASKAELDAFYLKVHAAVGTGADLASALLVARPSEHQIVGPVDQALAPTSAWDTTTGASPYIFNVSVRSEYGMGGAFWDGSKLTGLKSMVCANFTGTNQQKDMRCWQVYQGGNWVTLPNTPQGYQTYINTDPDNVRRNPARQTRHISAINDAYIQKVSIFGIGQSEVTMVDSGGEITDNGGNSTFGGGSALAKGYKSFAFGKDKNWVVGRVRVPLNISEKTSNIRRIELGVVAAVSGSAITLSTGLAIDPSSTTNPAVLQSLGYSFASGTKIWIDNPAGDDWRATLSTSAWSSSSPANIGIIAAPLQSNTNEAAGDLVVGRRVYLRRVVDTRTVAERRASLILNNTSSARMPQRNTVLQTDPNRSNGSISRVLAAGGEEVLMVTASGKGPLPGAGVTRTAEVTIRRGAPSKTYASGTYYRQGTVVKHAGKHWQAVETFVSSDSSPDPALWGETFVHMPSDFNPEDSVSQEAPILVLDTDTSDVDDSTTLGINWTTIWTAAGPVRDQYRTGTDYLGAFAFLRALGFTDAAAHAALVPRTAGSRDRDPSIVTDFPTAPSGGAATGLGNWAVEFRRPSTIRLYNHQWEWAGFGNYSKAMPAVQGDMSEFNKFTYYFTNSAGGRVTPKGSNEDGFEVTPKGLEDIATGATISPESLGGQGIDEAQRTDFPNGIQVGGTAQLQDVVIDGNAEFSSGAMASTSKPGAVQLATIADYDAGTVAATSNAQLDSSNNKGVTLPGLNRWREQRNLLSGAQPGATVVMLHVASGTPLTGDSSVPFGYPTSGHTYDGPTGMGLRGRIFSSVTAALAEASNIYVPVGSEIVISVHDSLSVVEAGPLTLGNGITPWVVAGARGSTAPKMKLSAISTTNGTARLPQIPVNCYLVGGIVADMEVEFDQAGTSGIRYLTLDGGFGIGERDTTIRWINVGSGSTLNNATCTYGGKTQIRVYFTPSVGSNKKLSTVINGASGATAPTFNFFAESGGLLGHGASLVYDFGSPAYGVGGNNVVEFDFDHDYSSQVPLRFYSLGGRGGCKTGSRIGPFATWNFNGKSWNLAQWVNSNFRNTKNYNGPSFTTLPVPSGGSISDSYGISAATAATLTAIQLGRGSSLDITSESAKDGGAYGLLLAVEGQAYSGGTVPATMITAKNFEGSYVYGGSSTRNLST